MDDKDDRGTRALSIQVGLLLAAGGPLILAAAVGPLVAFGVVAAPVLGCAAGPVVARWLAVRRLRRWLRRL
ncbi:MULTISPECIES: hypothetical protein [Streptomyces]|uniref:hypothetical protein n=1 Tax=Streptomyces TaxID=1883 RepID=UPI00163C6301|nr:MULTISPECIES: hypothetical protein [Streptomyces]MBC2879798.1 hypothetical protein [Streptomyces sp. TYQ1024]UBI41404.1 hypothetical protein K7I03_33610 [Streptomyces mobaraensis]